MPCPASQTDANSMTGSNQNCQKDTQAIFFLILEQYQLDFHGLKFTLTTAPYDTSR